MKTSKVLACIGMLALGLTVCDAVAVGQNRRVSRPTSRTINRSTTSTTTTNNNNTTQHYATVADYLRSTEYRSKERASALVEATSERLQKLPDVIANSEGVFRLINTKQDGSSTSEELFGTDESIIFPGNLLYVNKQMADGNPDPCAFATGQVRITIDLNLGAGTSISAVVPNDYASVKQQIFNWLNAKTEKSFGNLDSEGGTHYYSNSSHMAVDLKVSASYLKNKAKVNMNTQSNELKIVAVENFTQKYYTVTAQVINNDPSTLIGKGTSVNEVINGVNANGPIGMILNVSYGRRAYRFREYTSNDFTFNGDESVNVNAGGAQVSVASTQNVTNSSKCSRFWGYVQGGKHSDKEIFNNTDANNGNSDFMKAMTKATEITASNPGVALNYTVRFVSSQGLAQKHVTNEYYKTEYVPCPKWITIEMHKDASQVAQSSIELRFNYQVIHVTKNSDGKITSYEIWNSPRSKDDSILPGYVDYTRRNFDQGETRITRTIPTNDVPDKENCYIYGNLYWTLRGNHRSGQSWTTWDDGYMSPMSIPTENGRKIVRMYIDGSNYGSKNPYIHSKSTGRSSR